MYHSLRAATFFSYGGDDHEKHVELPLKLPHDFPDRANWENALKNARLERNKADYDPYPKREASFRDSAIVQIVVARSLPPIVGIYLKGKGCT